MTVVAIIILLGLFVGAVLSTIRATPHPYKSRNQAALVASVSGFILYWMFGPMLWGLATGDRSASLHLTTKTPSAIWAAKVDTLACATLRSVETLQFLDALKRSQGVRNPASDASQTDCVSVKRGTQFGVYKFDRDFASVALPGHGQLYMLSNDIGVGH